jgi:hypothetical protein
MPRGDCARVIFDFLVADNAFKEIKCENPETKCLSKTDQHQVACQFTFELPDPRQRAYALA